MTVYLPHIEDAIHTPEFSTMAMIKLMWGGILFDLHFSNN